MPGLSNQQEIGFSHRAASGVSIRSGQKSGLPDATRDCATTYSFDSRASKVSGSLSAIAGGTPTSDCLVKSVPTTLGRITRESLQAAGGRRRGRAARTEPAASNSIPAVRKQFIG